MAPEQSSGRVPHLIRFSLRSLFTEYGRGFLFGILLGRPIKAIKGMATYAQKNIDSSDLSREKTLVGLGFCLKPLQPACPSERANHDCRYFDEALHLNPKTAPKACQGCAIRKIATEALAAGCDLYIMTSARDILYDLLKPAVKKPCFHRALLALCRYSIEPFRLAVSAVGLKVDMFPFAEGDCRTYREWRRADLGRKPDRTRLAEADEAEFLRLLRAARIFAPHHRRYVRTGRMYLNVPRNITPEG